jgi:hypothetical protein
MKTCYVSQPFGSKPATLKNGQSIGIDFDRIYFDVIKPAVQSAGYHCTRGDDGPKSGVIHKRLLKAVLESDAMVADLSTRNPNVIYDLGIRHTVQRGSTIIIGNETAFPLPFSLNNLYMQQYDINDAGTVSGPGADRLRAMLKDALAEDGISSPIHEYFPELRVDLPKRPCVFVGHGRSKLWARVQTFLQSELKLETIAFESESRVGESIVHVLESMLQQSTFAVMVATAEDETAAGSKRARQNVVHEIGLFQGRLAFPRVVLLNQKGIEEFSNVAGLQYISFEGDNIEQTFYELRRALEREGLLAPPGGS